MSDPKPNSPEDIGHVPRSPRTRPPPAAIESVRFDGARWEATVRKTDGKRTWVYANTERDARAAALKEVTR